LDERNTEDATLLSKKKQLFCNVFGVEN